GILRVYRTERNPAIGTAETRGDYEHREQVSVGPRQLCVPPPTLCEPGSFRLPFGALRALRRGKRRPTHPTREAQSKATHRLVGPREERATSGPNRAIPGRDGLR